MDHNRIYIEELIRKQLMEQLTADEAQELEKEKARYTADEYDLMVIAMLDELKGQLPEGFLTEWQPDYDAIRKAGDRIRRGKKKTKRWTMIRRSAAMLLLVFVATGLFFIFFFRSEESNMLRFEGDCIHLVSNADIPLSESACTIYLGDSTVIRVTADHVGKIRHIGNLLISRTKEGLLRLERRPNAARGPTIAMVDPVIATTVRQQCVVQLEDGTLIRLNAQSYIRYPLKVKDTIAMEFGGEALVTATDAPGKGLLRLHTKHGSLRAEKADFVVAASGVEMKAVLDKGIVRLYPNSQPEPLALRRHKDFGAVRRIAAQKSRPAHDTVVFAQNEDLEMIKNWTKAMRTYRNVSLRVFVAEVSRWDGFKIKDWSCIPADSVVNTAVCYRNDRSEILAAIRAVGVRIEEERGLLSFCPEEKKKWVAVKEDD